MNKKANMLQFFGTVAQVSISNEQHYLVTCWVFSKLALFSYWVDTQQSWQKYIYYTLVVKH